VEIFRKPTSASMCASKPIERPPHPLPTHSLLPVPVRLNHSESTLLLWESARNHRMWLRLTSGKISSRRERPSHPSSSSIHRRTAAAWNKLYTVLRHHRTNHLHTPLTHPLHTMPLRAGCLRRSTTQCSSQILQTVYVRVSLFSMYSEVLTFCS